MCFHAKNVRLNNRLRYFQAFPDDHFLVLAAHSLPYNLGLFVAALGGITAGYLADMRGKHVRWYFYSVAGHLGDRCRNFFDPLFLHLVVRSKKGGHKPAKTVAVCPTSSSLSADYAELCVPSASSVFLWKLSYVGRHVCSPRCLENKKCSVDNRFRINCQAMVEKL